MSSDTAPKVLRKPRRQRRVRGSIIRVKAREETYKIKFDLPRAERAPRKTEYRTIKGTKADAEKELRRLTDLADAGVKLDIAKQPFGDWVETWLRDHISKRSAKTRERYEELMRKHVVPALGAIPLEKVDLEAIEALYRHLETAGREMPLRKGELDRRAPTGLAFATLKYVHRVLFMCLKEAKRLSKIQINAAENVDMNAFRPASDSEVDDAEEVALTKEMPAAADMVRMIAAFKAKPLKNAPHALIVLAFDSGARRGELLALRWSDVNLDRRTVSIKRAVTEAKKRVWVKPKPKNKPSIRTIGISAGTVAILRELARATNGPPDRLLFPHNPWDGSVPIKPRFLTQQFRSTTRRIPGFEDFTFHDLRHACASHMLDLRCTPADVAAHLGHSTVDTTMKVYAHKIAEIRKLDDERERPRPPGLLDRLAAREPSGNDPK